MLFLISAVAFAAAVFFFIYGTQLSRHEALPRWAQRESVLTGGALGFTLLVPLTLIGMFQGGPVGSALVDVGIAIGVAVAASVGAYILAVHFANGGRRGKRLRV